MTGQFFMAKGIPQQFVTLLTCRVVPLYLLLPVAFNYYGFDGAIWVIATNSFFSIPLTYYYQYREGIFDLKKELLVLPALPAGALIGKGIAYLLG